MPTPPPHVSSFVIAIATEKVQTLITKMGFDVVNAGPLKSARNIEPLATLNISLGYGQGLGTSMGLTLLR
jgi:8-hydroxy-5-deazaflavin:NADPH oxidoreductase